MVAFVIVTPQGKRQIQRVCACSPCSFITGIFASVHFCPDSSPCPPGVQLNLQPNMSLSIALLLAMAKLHLYCCCALWDEQAKSNSSSLYSPNSPMLLEVWHVYPTKQPSLCADTSPKEAIIGSHLLLHCSVTASSTSLPFHLPYVPNIYLISVSFDYFSIHTYRHHYSHFSSVFLKKAH